MILRNNLTGSIPFQVEMLTDLNELILSGNNFLGTVPSKLNDILYQAKYQSIRLQIREVV